MTSIEPMPRGIPASTGKMPCNRPLGDTMPRDRFHLTPGDRFRFTPREYEPALGE